MSDFIDKLLEDRSSVNDGDDVEELKREALLLRSIGAENFSDFKTFFYIINNIKKIAKELAKRSLDNKELAELSSFIFQNRKEKDIDSIYNFYSAVEEGLNKINIPIKKLAYPQPLGSFFIEQPYNLKKWEKAAVAIKMHQNQGLKKNEAFNLLTKNWETMERLNFKDWLNFFEKGGGSKYKKAQMNYVTIGDGSAFLPNMDKLKSQLPNSSFGRGYTEPSKVEFNLNNDTPVENIKKQKEETEREKSKETKRQVKSLLSRLNSAKKILRSDEMTDLLGDQLEQFLRALQEVETDISLVGLKNKRSSIFYDLIIRKGNQQKAKGFTKSASVLYKLAQAAPPPLETTEETAEPTDTAAETPPTGSTKEETSDEIPLPESNLEQPLTPPSSTMEDDSVGSAPVEEPEDKQEEWIKEFLSNLEGSTYEAPEEEDSTPSAEENSPAPTSGTDDFSFVADEIIVTESDLDYEDDIVVFAQEAQQVAEQIPLKEDGPLAPDTIPEGAPNPDAVNSVETRVEDKVKALPTENNSGLDEAFQNVTVDDAIDRLDKLKAIFQTREISHQLSLVDMILDRLGLSPYFPDLAEATQKSLDANQYCLTRIEDVISRLQGAVMAPSNPTDAFDLEGKEKRPPNAETAGVQGKLESDKQKEEQRKKNREEQRDKKEEEMMAAPEQTEPEIAQEVAQQPVNLKQTGEGIKV